MKSGDQGRGEQKFCLAFGYKIPNVDQSRLKLFLASSGLVRSAMLNKLLIANRGEIASRISRSALDRNLPTVLAHTPEDAALSRRIGASQLVQLPTGGYTDIDGLINLALEHGCDSIHPGYGFLSESADFARAVRAADLKFLEPARWRFSEISSVPGILQSTQRSASPLVR